MIASEIYDIVRKYNLRKFFSKKGGVSKCTNTESMMKQQKKY